MEHSVWLLHPKLGLCCLILAPLSLLHISSSSNKDLLGHLLADPAYVTYLRVRVGQRLGVSPAILLSPLLPWRLGPGNGFLLVGY